MNFYGRETVDSAVDSAPKMPPPGDLLSTFRGSRQVDIHLSKLFMYSYIPENKGKVEIRSKEGRKTRIRCLPRQKFARYVYLSTAVGRAGVPA